jgi:hypothetical protein
MRSFAFSRWEKAASEACRMGAAFRRQPFAREPSPQLSPVGEGAARPRQSNGYVFHSY